MAATLGDAQAEAFACVVAVRDATSVEAQREAACALEAAASKHGNHPLLMDAGVASVLSAALRKWDDVDAKKNCTRAIAHLANCRNGDRHMVFAEAGILEPLVACVPHEDHKWSTAAAALHWLTGDNPEVTQQLRDVPGVMETLESTEGSTSGWIGGVLVRLRPLKPTGRLLKPARE